jgi:hypothetical protein
MKPGELVVQWVLTPRAQRQLDRYVEIRNHDEFMGDSTRQNKQKIETAGRLLLHELFSANPELGARLIRIEWRDRGMQLVEGGDDGSV